MANSKSLVKFNIQNIKWAIKNKDGEYETPQNYGTATSMSLETDSSVKQIFGDGQIIASIISDKGKTGVMNTNSINNDYEIQMGRKLRIQTGLIDINQSKTVEHAIYFEIKELQDNNEVITSKTWLLGCFSPTRPSESFEQDTDEVNESTFDTDLEIRGMPLLNQDGNVYKDDSGNSKLVWQITVVPGDEGYEDFESEVVIPRITQED